jgi:hypothetical protein
MGFQGLVTAPKGSVNAQHWLKRAEEMRQIAEIVADTDVKQKLLEIAKTYDRLASRASGNDTPPEA